jgi:hypothetical protein
MTKAREKASGGLEPWMGLAALAMLSRHLLGLATRKDERLRDACLGPIATERGL